MATPTTPSPGPTPYTNEVVRRIFVETADQNYVTARWAFLNELNVDFFWLGLHALEKYLKAILLLNGQSAKSYGHDIERLYQAVLKLDLALSFGPLTKPTQVNQDIWRDESVDAFVKRINEQGDPSNRYMLYGYVLWGDDLIKLDQLVWSVRRHCRPFRQTLNAGAGETMEINWVEDLKKNPAGWRLNGINPIEKAAHGKTSEEVRHALFNLNFAFMPDYEHVTTRARISSANPPLANWFEVLKSDQASPDIRQTANDTLQWVLDNIQLTKSDRKTIKDALTAQPSMNIGMEYIGKSPKAIR